MQAGKEDVVFPESMIRMTLEITFVIPRIISCELLVANLNLIYIYMIFENFIHY